MPAKIDVYSAIWGQEFDELPDKCPKCGKNFHEDESLTEECYMAAEQTCKIGEDGLIDYEETTIKDFPEAQYVNAYKCSGCGHKLVEAEDAID